MAEKLVQVDASAKTDKTRGSKITLSRSGVERLKEKLYPGMTTLQRSKVWLQDTQALGVPNATLNGYIYNNRGVSAKCLLMLVTLCGRAGIPLDDIIKESHGNS